MSDYVKNSFCIVGATRGTGLLIARQLLRQGSTVRVIARDPEKAARLLGNRVEVYRGDVTDRRSIDRSLPGDCQAIFFTVDATGGIGGRALLGSRAAIREITYYGLVNVVDAALSKSFEGRFVLMSAMGADRSSVAWSILNALKPGLRRNILEREIYVRTSGLDYVTVRAPILTDAPAGKANIRITRATHKLTIGPRIPRGDVARAMIIASVHSAASRKTFDLFGDRGSPTGDHEIVGQLELIPADL